MVRGKLLVSIPNDMKMFRQETSGKVIVLGRKTLETFPNGLPLKSHRSVVAVPFSRTYINTVQSSNLATAGSGDVLAGICAGLTACGIDIKLAGAIGSYIHGLCGMRAGNGAIASDLINEIKEVINLELKRN